VQPKPGSGHDNTENAAMSEREITTVLSLTRNQINNPRFRRLILEYAGELAPPCVAEALMKLLKSTHN
jgi:hypothetical protein